MSPELLNILINGGGYAVIIWMLWDMRREAAEDRKQLWDLTIYLVKREDPEFDSQIARLPSDKRE